MLKVIQISKKLLYIIYSILSVSILSLFFINNTYADESLNVNYSVTVEPALNITTSSNKVSLDLNPLNHDFDSQDLTVSVSTNNETGYKLYVNTDSTKLIEKDDNSLYIETLSNETPENDFTSNRWGYRIGSGNYLPFASGTLINSSKTQVENNSSTLTFAAKVGYETKAGTYNLALNFQATANPHIPYIQNLDPTFCVTSESTLTIDARDEKQYYVRRLADGKCWMVSNLVYTGSTGDPDNTMRLNSATSNVADNYTEANPLTITYGEQTAGMSLTEAKLHVGTDSQNAPTVWYNYCAASAGEKCARVNVTTTYDVCPAGWTLPTKDDFNNIVSEAALFVDTKGFYEDRLLNDASRWWVKTPQSTAEHWAPCYINNTLNTACGANDMYAVYIRCLLK